MPCLNPYLQSKEYKSSFFAQQHPKDVVTEHLESMIHNLTRMLCSLCKEVESSFPSYFLENTELSAWWEEHKKNDKENEIRDLKKQISDIERKIINLMQ